MATIKMQKGDTFADIFDSEETIKNAQLDGWSIVEEKKEIKKEEVTETTEEVTAYKKGRKPKE